MFMSVLFQGDCSAAKCVSVRGMWCSNWSHVLRRFKLLQEDSKDLFLRSFGTLQTKRTAKAPVNCYAMPQKRKPHLLPTNQFSEIELVVLGSTNSIESPDIV